MKGQYNIRTTQHHLQKIIIPLIKEMMNENSNSPVSWTNRQTNMAPDESSWNPKPLLTTRNWYLMYSKTGGDNAGYQRLNT